MKNRVWVNGKFVESAKASISVFDRGFMYGDGAFETARSYAGIVFKLDEHIDRLIKDLKVLKIKPPYSASYLKEAVYATLKANKLSSAYIKIIVTRGEGRFGIGYSDNFSPNVIITAKDFEGYPEWMFAKGLSAKIIAPEGRFPALPGVKSLNYLTFILARLDAKEKKCDEAILTNAKGNITEASTSNIFLVKNGKLITPSLDSGILNGVTRAVIIGIARKLKINVVEKAVTQRELLSADECFFTNSLAEVLPVTRVDSKDIGLGIVGPVTKLLHISYQKQVIRETL